ncbi:MAG: tetratricopeptide repeat protein [Verrucomicrobiota bacterium]|nr:tetratricopeptide repeat protein [Verrucomicrobiota bacterium]
MVDGLTEGLIHSLSRLKDLKVISRSSVFVFKNKEINPQEVGRRLGVMGLIEGSVQKRDNRARVLLRLVSTKDGKVLWSTETSEQPMNDLLKVENGLAQKVSAALRPQLEKEQAAKLARGQTQVPEAHQAYLKGLYFWNKRTFDDLEKSVSYFKQAIEKDPGYALAHAGLANAYALLNYYGGSEPDQTYPKAREAAQRAIKLDPSLAQAHTALAYIMRAYDWDWAGAEREFQRAIALNPNYATAHFWYGEQLSLLGRFDEGIAEIQRAEEIDPLSPIISGSVGWAYHMARQPDRAIAQLQKALELDPNYAMTHFYLGMAYEGKGMSEEAIAAYRKSQEISPLGPGIVGLGHAYAASGRHDEARRILQQLVERVAHHQARPTGVAIVAAGLNDADTAFAWLERAYEERAEGVMYLKAQPYFDNLRSDPRRPAFLQRIGLAEF